MRTNRRTAAAAAVVVLLVQTALLTLIASAAAPPHRPPARTDTIADLVAAAKYGSEIIDPAALAMQDAQVVVQHMAGDAQFQKDVLTFVARKDAAGLTAYLQRFAKNSTVQVQQMGDFHLAFSFTVRGHHVFVCSGDSTGYQGCGNLDITVD